MNIAVIGTGYVGVTTAVSFALKGHVVTGIDVDAQKVERLKHGIVPLYEPGVEDALKSLLPTGNIRFTASLGEGVGDADVIFLCVGTPPRPDGQADLSYVWGAVKELQKVLPHRGHPRVLAVKSTVPVGTSDHVAELLRTRGDVLVASNPEFLREGSALADALEPSRIVIGADAEEAFALMDQVYAPMQAPSLHTTRANAEMIKYASNAYLATRISFVNELARLCDRIGADVTVVVRGMGMDSRIGPSFLNAGLGYGGSCFPKDTAALLKVAEEQGLSLPVIQSGIHINEGQVAWFFDKIKQSFDSLHDKKIAVLGLSFKPDTDDIRDSPALRLIPLLTDAGAEVTAADPAAVDNARRVLPNIRYTGSAYEALRRADAAVLATEWREFVQLDWKTVKSLMARPCLFDGRNAWPGEKLAKMGFAYTGVGKS